MQVKHQPSGKTFIAMHKEIQERLQTLFPDHDRKNFYSLIYTTHETIHVDIPENCICFDAWSIGSFVLPFGYLNVLDTKTYGISC